MDGDSPALWTPYRYAQEPANNHDVLNVLVFLSVFTTQPRGPNRLLKYAYIFIKKHSLILCAVCCLFVFCAERLYGYVEQAFSV